MKKPNFKKLWDAFPDHVEFPTLADLYAHLGGAAQRNINVPGFGPNGNTCASRLSIALNESGAPINMDIANAIGASTLGTSGESRIIFRVQDLRKYLLKTIGKPTVDKASPYDDSFVNRRGIVAFSVNWTGATGHIALWNGRTYREPKFDNYSSYVSTSNPSVRTTLGEFWELV